MANITTATRQIQPPQQPRPCYLLKLPAELRLHIYREVFSLTSFDPKSANASEVIYPSLLYTCTQIFHEAQSVVQIQYDEIVDSGHQLDSLVTMAFQAQRAKFLDDIRRGVISDTTELEESAVREEKTSQTVREMTRMLEVEYARIDRVWHQIDNRKSD